MLLPIPTAPGLEISCYARGSLCSILPGVRRNLGCSACLPTGSEFPEFPFLLPGCLLYLCCSTLPTGTCGSWSAVLDSSSVLILAPAWEF